MQRQIDPWEVVPSEWIFYPDLLTGKTPPVNLALIQDDPRAGLIEEVEFTAPNELSINSMRVNAPRQFLAFICMGNQGV